MLNITGGIGNVTVGESGLAGEWIAKEFLGLKTMLLVKLYGCTIHGVLLMTLVKIKLQH